MIAAARRSGRWVTVDHNRWFDPVVQRAARAGRADASAELVGVEVFQGAEAGEADKLQRGDDALERAPARRRARTTSPRIRST